MNFSDKVKYVRNKLQLSQDELAKKLGVSFATVNRWEQGDVLPHNNTSLKFDEFCKIHNIIFEKASNVHTGLTLITARQIECWFSLQPQNSQANFPELIERLIAESAKGNFKKLRFPSKDKIVLDGFDGEVTYDDSNNLFIPFKDSVWELGSTTINSVSKIKEDYKKRSIYTPMAQKESTTFVLVTPKSISSSTKSQLLSYFNKHNWKEIRIYDAVDLELWLSQCLATSIWLHEKFTNEKIDIVSFENAYTNFIDRTVPKLSTKLFTTKREDERRLFFDLLKTSRVIKVSSTSKEESFGFVISTLKETNDENVLSKIIICNNYSSLIKVDALTTGKILILTSPVGNHNISKNNQFIFIFGRDTADHSINVSLNIRPQSCIMDVLKNEMKVPATKLSEISHRAKNNIMLIMREIEDETSHTSNNWRNDPEIEKLIPILMVGKIDLINETDRKILSSFLPEETDLDSYITFLKKWENRDNSPLFFYGENIKVCLKEELWISVKNLITPKAIDILTQTIKDILKTINPKFELPAEKRAAHQIYHKVWNFNKHIINGLLDSCILLTIYNNEQTKIDLLIRQVLECVSSTESLFTLSEFFNLIAECSPNEFLSYIEKEIKDDKSYIFALFANNNTSSLFESGYDYCNLLWALELLTNIDETKIRACNILMSLKLKGLVCGISNCPEASLLNILHWLNRKNALTFNDRKNIVVKFIKTHGRHAFDIALNLISASSVTFSGSDLRWRNPDLVEEEITYSMIYGANEEYVNAILSTVEHSDLETIQKIIKLHSHLTKKSLDSISNFIQKIYSHNTKDSTDLYEYILSIRYSSIKYVDDNNEEYFLKTCENWIKILKPSDLLDSSLVYFKHFGYNDCPVPETIDEDFDKEEKKVRKYQSELFKKLYDNYDHDMLIGKIATVLPNNGVDGNFFATQNLSSQDIDLFVESAKRLKKFHFLVSFLSNLGTNILESFINEQDKNFIMELIPYIHNLISVPNVILQDEELTELLYRHREMNQYAQANDLDLIKLYNPMSYIRWVLYDVEIENWDVTNIISVLNNIKAEHIKGTDYYYLRKIFSQLDQNYDNEEILKLEIKFFNIFEYNEIPNGIKKYLFNNPQEYISLIDSANTEKKIDPSMWYKFIMYMSFPTNFETEPDKIDQFICAIMNYSNLDERKVALLRSNLGSILARSFSVDEEHLLPQGLINIVEKWADDNINRGIVIGYENMRGVRFVGDGTSELKLSESYEANAKNMEILYPVSAKILRALAKNRKFDAEQDKADRMLMDDLL